MAEQQPELIETRLHGELGDTQSQSAGWLRLQARKLTSSLWRTILSLIAFVALVSLLSGAIMYWGFDEFDNFQAAAWWSFEHLMEPSALEQDQGEVRRTFGIFLVFCGHIFLFGILLAILTELVGNSLRDLADVDPPYTRHDHLVVVGWNEGLPDMLAVVVGASQQEHTSRDGPLRDIVVLVPLELRPKRASIEALLHERVQHARIAVRFGDPASRPSYAVVGAERAWAIFVTPTPRAGFTPRSSDAAMIQTALTIDSYLNEHGRPERLPQVSVTFFWGEDVDAAMSVLPARFDGLVWDRIWSGYMSMGLANLDWARAAEIVIGPGGQSLYLVPAGDLTGLPFKALHGALAEALPVGIMHADGAPGHLHYPAPDEALRADDMIVVLAPSAERAIRKRGTPAPPAAPHAVQLPAEQRNQHFTLLVVGANHRVVALLDEFADVTWATFTIVNLSRMPVDERRMMLTSGVRERLDLKYVQALASDRLQLKKAIDQYKPHAILVTGDWADHSDENLDADAILNFLTVKAIVGDSIPVQSTTYSPSFASILDAHAGDQVVTRTGRIVANTLALSLLRPDLVPVLDTSFNGDVRYLTDLQSEEPVRFDELYQGVLAAGGMLYAFVTSEGELHINPPLDSLVPGQARLLITTARADQDAGDDHIHGGQRTAVAGERPSQA